MLESFERADFCVGYFNLRGWRSIDAPVDLWAGGEQACCRLMIGMQSLPQDELRAGFNLTSDPLQMDQQTVSRLKKHVAQEFRSRYWFSWSHIPQLDRQFLRK